MEIAVGRGGECNEHTRPAVPPPTSVRPRSSRIVSPRDNVRRRRCRARRCVACHSGNNATAPRSSPKRARRILEWLSVTCGVLLQRNSGLVPAVMASPTSHAHPGSSSIWIADNSKSALSPDTAGSNRILAARAPSYAVNSTRNSAGPSPAAAVPTSTMTASSS